MRITIEPDLTTSVDYFFAYPHKIFKNQHLPTNFLKIPLQQREYDWGNFDLIAKDGNNIEELLEDLDNHLVFGVNNYFAGTTLLENQNSNYLKVIDGQQRVTTIFLLNICGYLISRYRLEKMPTFPNPINYALQFKDRFDSFLLYEQRAFISNLSDDVQQLIDQSGSSQDGNTELLKRIGRSSNAEQDYWSKVIMRLQFDDIDINSNFTETIKKANVFELNDDIEIKSVRGFYTNGLNIIIEYLHEQNPKGPLSTDQYLKELLQKIEKYLKVCGLAAIISEDSDDSFRLFEILNDRGQDLSALDLIKNIILERCNQTGQQIADFSRDWKKLKDNVRKTFSKGKADSIFVENIIRSESSTIKNKEISYLNNKIPNERNILFVNETIVNFYNRLLASSSILKELNENLLNDRTQNSSPFTRFPMSCIQYTTFMKMINYNWGPQIILSSNIQYLASSRYINSLNSGANADWKNNTSNQILFDLNHFTRFLGDVTLKAGMIGIVNGLATKELPTVSKDISKLIVNNVTNNLANFNSAINLMNLKTQIISILNASIFTPNNISLFETRLGDTFLASTGPKKNLIKILLYFIYNKGGAIHRFNFPELEHLESSRPTAGTQPYYSGVDRDDIINKLGNFALIEKNINIVDFSNKPLIEKINLATTDPSLTSILLFQNDLFLNLNYLNPKTSSTIYGTMPLIKRATGPTIGIDDSFDSLGVPQQYFFSIRGKFLARLSRSIVCNTTTFLDSSGSY